VYSTCTYNPLENEEQVATALRNFRGTLVLEPPPSHADFGEKGILTTSLAPEHAAMVRRFPPGGALTQHDRLLTLTLTLTPTLTWRCTQHDRFLTLTLTPTPTLTWRCTQHDRFLCCAVPEGDPEIAPDSDPNKWTQGDPEIARHNAIVN